MNGPQVARPSPSIEALRQAFRQEVTRTQRRSDGTMTIDGVRFELPNRFRHLQRVTVRYARWNLRDVHLVDPRSDTLLTAIYPLDKARNADGTRRVFTSEPMTDPVPNDDAGEQLAPLLRKLIAQYAATGIPPAYLPKPSHDEANP